jgi:hypothetical protein
MRPAPTGMPFIGAGDFCARDPKLFGRFDFPAFEKFTEEDDQ